MLLCHQIGCCSFVDIRTVDAVVYPTYRSSCEKLGLLDNDNVDIRIVDGVVYPTNYCLCK